MLRCYRHDLLTMYNIQIPWERLAVFISAFFIIFVNVCAHIELTQSSNNESQILHSKMWDTLFELVLLSHILGHANHVIFVKRSYSLITNELTWLGSTSIGTANEKPFVILHYLTKGWILTAKMLAWKQWIKMGNITDVHYIYQLQN